MKKKLLSIFAALAVAVGMSACQTGETGQGSQSIEAVSSTTLASESTQTSETTTSYNPYDYPAYPLPEGWTFEKICNLFEIDGVPLSLKFTDKDFENINEKIEVKQEFHALESYTVYYDNEDIAAFESLTDDELISRFIFGYTDKNQEIIDSMTFAGYSLTEVEQIYSYMNENFTKSHEYIEDIERGTGFKVYVLESEDSELTIYFFCDYEYNKPRLSIWFSITEKETNNNE